MSERRVPEPDSMDKLMELQSRLRELTEAKRAKWREAGSPLPEPATHESPGYPPPDTGRDGAGVGPPDSLESTTASAMGPDSGVVPEPESSVVPEPESGVVPEPESGVVPEPESGVVPEPVSSETRSTGTGRRSGEDPTGSAGECLSPVDSAPTGTDGRFARRRDATADWSRALERHTEAARRWAGAFWRQAVGQARDLTGGLGTRKAKPRPRPGDPVTAAELIDDRSLGARILGAAVFFVGLVAIGAVALVQLGKLQVPWLEENALPAATTPAQSGADRTAGGSGPAAVFGTPDASGRSQHDADEGEPGILSADERETGSDAGPSAIPEDEKSSDVELSEDTAGALVTREVLEFTRLQGELAFLLGEYDIVSKAFDRGEADCVELTGYYSSVDSTHLLMSRVVARWREVPYRHVKAYEEISGMVDRTLQHFAASGCGLDPSELPGDR